VSTEGSPKWWILYLGTAIFMGLFAAESQLPLSEVEHQVIEVGMLVLAYFLGNLWLSASRRGLLHDSYRDYRGVTKHTQIESMSATDTTSSHRNRNKAH
jgi:hypothetical protein